MGLPLKPTLSALRSELMTRTGFGAQGSPSLVQRSLFDSFLQGAQAQVWYALKYEERRTTEDLTFNTGQTLYDWPDNVDLTKLCEIRVRIDDQIWRRLNRGIETVHDTVLTSADSYPKRYDHRGGQIEIWPEPDQSYTGRIEYYPRLAAFTQDTDRLSMPKELVFNLGLYKAKLHYRQPDAEEALAAHNQILAAIRAGQNEDVELRRPTAGDRRRRRDLLDDPYPKPIMES